MAARFPAREFKGVVLEAVIAASAAVRKIRKIRVDDEIIRRLRQSMVATEHTRATLLEALTLIMRQIAERATSRNVRYAQVTDIIRAVEAESSDDEETKWVRTANLAAAPTWQARRILDAWEDPPLSGNWVYLVDWEPTVKPPTNLSRNLIAAFDNERRALVRAAYIEYEAVEA